MDEFGPNLHRHIVVAMPKTEMICDLDLIFKITRFIENTELNGKRKMICLRKSKVSVEEIQFVMSFKIWQSMAHTVCHAPIPMMSWMLPNNFAVILMSK